MTDDARLTILQVRTRDNATGAVVAGATGRRAALLDCGASAALAVCMPLLAYSVLTIARAWQDVKRQRSERRERVSE